MFLEANIRALLRATFHPKEAQLAAFVDRTLEPRQQQKIERHLASCNDCCDQIGTLIRSQRQDIEVEPALLSRAVGLARSSQVRTVATRQWTLAAAGGLAASVIGAAAILYWLGSSPTVPSARTTPSPPASGIQVAAAEPPTTSLKARPSADVLRGRKAGMRVVITSPVPGSRLDAQTPIQWRQIPEAMSYDVRLLAENGDVLWMDQLQAHNVRIPDTVQLTPGSQYFVIVRAYLIGGKTIDSAAIKFRFVPKM